MINILIVDDSDIVYQGIKIFVDTNNGIKIIGKAENGSEAIEFVDRHSIKPDIILMDLMMPVMGGIKSTEELCRQFPEIKIIIFSDMKDKNIANCAFNMGAKGYLIKSNINSLNLINAIYSVYNGYIQIDEEVSNNSLTNLLTGSPTSIKVPKRQNFNVSTKPNTYKLKNEEFLVSEDIWA